MRRGAGFLRRSATWGVGRGSVPAAGAGFAPAFAPVLALALMAVTPQPAAAATMQASASDTAWLLTATALVLLMTLPGLALFYAGLVRARNAVSVMAQVSAAACVAALVWVLWGYSLTYTGGTWASFFGGLWKAGLRGIGPESLAASRGLGGAVPEYVFVAFQMTFACITPALIVGAFAERMRFSACLLFVALWVTFVYVPIAHMAWYAPGADALAEAARAVEQAVGPEAKRKAVAALALLQSDAGLFAKWGALDFAGGSVVHINAGIAGLIGAVTVGRRIGYGSQSMAPHSLPLTIAGAGLLWVGWFGFNAGSALKADGVAALALLNTFVAGAAGAIAWVGIEHLRGAYKTSLGLVTGLLAGLVVITPAAGYVAPLAALGLGAVSALACYMFCTSVKARYQYDDALDVFGVHCVGGVIGMLALAVLANPQLGGTGVVDFVARPGFGIVAPYDWSAQLWAQTKAVLVTLAWSGYATARILTLVDMATSLRLPADAEGKGHDVSDHGERAYNS